MKTVLIVDDALFMRVSLRNILANAGYVSIEAGNGAVAVEAFRTHRPDLVFIDTTMPVMDGVTAIKKIREIDLTARCVVCSALGQKNLVTEALRAGARDFIVKPFQAEKVLAIVRGQIGLARAAA